MIVFTRVYLKVLGRKMAPELANRKSENFKISSIGLVDYPNNIANYYTGRHSYSLE